MLSTIVHAIFPRGGETARGSNTRLEICPFHKEPTGSPGTYTLSASDSWFPVSVNPVRRPNVHHLLKFDERNRQTIVAAIERRNNSETVPGYVWNLVGFITSEPQGTLNPHSPYVQDFGIVLERVYDYVNAPSCGGASGVGEVLGRLRASSTAGGNGRFSGMQMHQPPKYAAAENLNPRGHAFGGVFAS